MGELCRPFAQIFHCPVYDLFRSQWSLLQHWPIAGSTSTTGCRRLRQRTMSQGEPVSMQRSTLPWVRQLCFVGIYDGGQTCRALLVC